MQEGKTKKREREEEEEDDVVRWGSSSLIEGVVFFSSIKWEIKERRG